MFIFQKGYGQGTITGAWEGSLMNNFRTVLNLGFNEETELEGNIKMFSDNNLIQDDLLENIKHINYTLTFFIPAKETTFQGSFDSLLNQLSGEFFFPDGSRHAIQFQRKLPETNFVEDFLRLKKKRIDIQALHSDLFFLDSILRELHPQLYSFLTKDSLDRLLERTFREISQSLTLEEFYLYAAKLTNAVQCSHTGVKLPSSYQKKIEIYGYFFPLRLYFDKGKAFYISGKSAGKTDLSPGDEVVGINNRAIHEIINQLFFYLPSEGCNTTTKYNELNKSFNTLFYLIDDSEEFNVQYKNGDTIKSVNVSASHLSEINFDFNSNAQDKQLEFTYVANGTIAVLKNSSFAIPDMDLYFNQLDQFFGNLKTNKIENLIIDLRDNSGGHPIFAAQLFSYLTDSVFVYFKRNDEVPEFEPLYNLMQPNSLNFLGNVYVLVNGGCLSTTGHLISLLRFYTNAVFVGEEPGSTFRCNDFSIQVTLPKSGIRVNVPRTTFETSVSGFAVCQPFHLDYEINEKVSDIINREDPYLKRVLSLVQNNRR